jgi:hypothetical protein
MEFSPISSGVESLTDLKMSMQYRVAFQLTQYMGEHSGAKMQNFQKVRAALGRVIATAAKAAALHQPWSERAKQTSRHAWLLLGRSGSGRAYLMFIAMNRVHVAKEAEAAFEHVWMSRDGHLDKVPSL